MDIALLIISFISFGSSVAALLFLKFTVDRLKVVMDEYHDGSEKMKSAGKILGELHNEQVGRVKVIGEKVENLEIRLQGVMGQPKRGF